MGTSATQNLCQYSFTFAPMKTDLDIIWNLDKYQNFKHTAGHNPIHSVIIQLCLIKCMSSPVQSVRNVL